MELYILAASWSIFAAIKMQNYVKEIPKNDKTPLPTRISYSILFKKFNVPFENVKHVSQY